MQECDFLGDQNIPWPPPTYYPRVKTPQPTRIYAPCNSSKKSRMETRHSGTG